MSSGDAPAREWQSRVIMLLIGLLTSVLATTAGYGWTEVQETQDALAALGERVAAADAIADGTTARLDRIEGKIDRLAERIDAVSATASRPPRR